jgi:hypothetical protein
MNPTTKARHLAKRCEKKCAVALWDEKRPLRGVRGGNTDAYQCLFFMGAPLNHVLVMTFQMERHVKYEKVVEWSARVERRFGLDPMNAAVATMPRPETLEQAKAWAHVVATLDIANE